MRNLRFSWRCRIK